MNRSLGSHYYLTIVERVACTLQNRRNCIFHPRANALGREHG